MHRLLQKIITNEAITIEFQGIYDLTATTLVGFEAICHGPQDSQLYNQNDLFESASRCGVLFELDSLCKRTAIERFSQLKCNCALFLNVNPMLLANPKYPQGQLISLAKQWGVKSSQIILEISEDHNIIASPILHRSLQQYRSLGFKVALTNVGSSNNTIKYWSYLQPDIIKVDPHFIQNANQDSAKLAFLEMLMSLGKHTDTKVVPQGVDKPEHLELLQDIGLNWAQGDFLSIASSEPCTNFPLIAQLNQKDNNSHSTTNIISDSKNTVQSLVTYPSTCTKDTKTGEVYKMLVANPKLQSIPVLDNDQAVGLVSRNHLMEKFSNAYAHALFDNNSIYQFMDANPLILDAKTTLDKASLIITQTTEQQISQYFIITSDNKYLGLASSRDLLRHITENKIEYARYANPLTLLPGNVPIDKQIDTLLADNQNFQLAYIDIDNFKPFNDVYGYAKGDQLIKLVAKTMEEHCEGKQTFVGHIGGDDFIILFKQNNSKAICDDIITQFANESLQFFDQQAIDKKGYFAVNRSGEQTLFPLVSLSIAVVTPDINLCHSHHDVSVMASEAKKEAKKIIGNSVFYCRRHSVSSHANKSTCKQTPLVLKTA